MPNLVSQNASEALPHSDEAERSVLGAVLLDNNQFHKAQELLAPAAFYSTRHRTIFQTMEGLMEGGTAIDLVTLKDRLENSRSLEACATRTATSSARFIGQSRPLVPLLGRQRATD